MSMPDSKETGTAETRRAGVRMSRARRCWPLTAFLQARPWAQLQLSVKNQSTQFSCWIPVLACGDTGQPYTSLQGCGHPYTLPEASLSKLSGVEAGPPASKHALCTQPSHGHTGGFLGATLPASLRPGLTRISVWCGAAWAWINDKGPWMKQTSLHSCLSRLPTYPVFSGFVFLPQ